MDEVKNGAAVPGTVAFRLGTLGTIATARFAAAVEPLDLKPKHVGVMTALDLGVAASQQDLALQLGVAPSLVVALADHLEHLGAIHRDRDPGDRRRQILTLTDYGRTLLAQCADLARQVDSQLTAKLSPRQLDALQDALAILAADLGLPTA
ncbi:MarR family winged helix-turn-helix transcriptional regulator [Nocardia sp. NPDC051052]|uniref:MarR family winged helix-turn-helix transcriptional regulator n=1 Tax=Nocardia sp. NPDC051052 TaxID=3364322 RepID=UPI0037BB0F49